MAIVRTSPRAILRRGDAYLVIHYREPLVFERLRGALGLLRLISFLAVYVLFSAESGFGSVSALDRLKTEAPEQWLAYRKIIASHTKGSLDSKYYETIPSRKLRYHSKASFVLNLDEHSARIDIDNEGLEGKKPKVAVLAINPDYQFEVEPGRADAWVISNIENTPLPISGDLIGPSPNSVVDYAMDNACLGERLYVAWLPRLFAAPEFKLIDVSDGEDGLVKVRYKFEPERPGGGEPIRSGTLLLDPAKYWLIREVKADAHYSYGEGKLKIVNTFSEFSDGSQMIPYVSHQVMHVSCPSPKDGKPREDDWTTNVELKAAVDLNPKQFTLSDFGLPEPEKKQHGTNWVLWIIIAVFSLSISRLMYVRWSTRHG